MSTAAAFYCVSSELYFPGAVGLINSLRLQGHGEPIYVLDCGLEAEHRELLAREATVVPAPAERPPYTLKTIAPRLFPAETMVLIDVDMVATRSLAPLIERAAAGRTVAFEDNIDRFVAEWGELLELGPLERRPYVSSGLVALGGELGAEVLRRWDERSDRGDIELSFFGADLEGYPLRFLDQDVLNAVLCATTAERELEALPARLAPHQPYRGLRLLDEARLRCAYEDGTEPFVLHQYLAKPWLEPMYHGIYSRLLARLWLGEGLALPFPEREVPTRMRSGARALVERRLVDAWDLARWLARDVLPERLRARRAAAGGRR